MLGKPAFSMPGTGHSGKCPLRQKSWKYKLISSSSPLNIVGSTISNGLYDMVCQYPNVGTEDEDVLEMIYELRRNLKHQVSVNPVRWTGFLRRNTFARALQGSNSIEGINASLADAVAII